MADVDDVPAPDMPAELAAALVAALGAMANVTNDARADAGTYTYAYASLGAVLAGARPVLVAHGLALVTPVHDAGNLIEVTATFVHVSGATWEACRLLLPRGGSVQQTGSAISYGRRYCALAALGIATEDDDGKSASQHPATVPEPEPDPVHELWQRVLTAIENDPAMARKLRAITSDARERLTERTLAASPRFAARIAAALDTDAAEYAVPQDKMAVTVPEPDPGPLDADLGGPTGVVDVVNAEDLASANQLVRVAVGFGAIGMKDRAAKHRLLGTITGRRITSAKQLTNSEASNVVYTLDQLATGELVIGETHTGEQFVAFADGTQGTLDDSPAP